MQPHLFEKTSSSLDVRPSERRRIHNGPVHMGFSREVHDRVNRVFQEDLTHLLWIGDVTANETIAWIFCNLLQVAKIAGIGQQVQVQNFDVRPRTKNVSYETRTDKPGSAGNEQFHCFLRMDAEPWMAACGISSAFASD